MWNSVKAEPRQDLQSFSIRQPLTLGSTARHVHSADANDRGQPMQTQEVCRLTLSIFGGPANPGPNAGPTSAHDQLYAEICILSGRPGMIRGGEVVTKGEIARVMTELINNDPTYSARPPSSTEVIKVASR